MADISLQINQLTGDSKSFLIGKKHGLNAQDELLAGMENFASFQTLITKLTAANTTATNTGTATIIKSGTDILNTTDILSGLNSTEISPDLLAALQSLTPEQLIQFAQNNVSNTTLNADITKIIDALSKIDVNIDSTSNLYEIIKDPVLADALINTANQIRTLQASGEIPLTSPFAENLKTVLANPIKAQNTETPLVFKETEEQTITIADLTPEEFNAFKKLAYADIAPFLTQPRLVRIDSGTVMKVAQGPAFLSENDTQNTMLNTTLTSLNASLTQDAIKAVQLLQNQTATAAPTVQTTLNTLTNAASAVTLLTAGAQNTSTAKIAANTTNPDITTESGQSTDAALITASTKTTNPILVTVTVANTQNAATLQNQSTGFTNIAKGLDNGLADTASFADALQIRADQNSPASSTTSLLSAKSAAHAHPATHLVSAVLQRAGENANNGMVGERQFTIQLDPPNLGRLKITLEFSINNTVKAKILAERPEAVSILQKDAALLERALQDSGFDASAPGAVTFNLAQDNSFSGNNSGEYQQPNQKNTSDDKTGTEFALIENVMPIFVDPITGRTHINIIV